MIDTPTTRSSKESHLRGDRVLPSIRTLKMAVVKIFSWYVTWNVAASRLLTARYCKVFCIVYSTAGIASFQLSFVKMAVVRVRNRVATVVFDGRVFDVSCNAFGHGKHLSARVTDIAYHT
jgi:hypothetical protein